MSKRSMPLYGALAIVFFTFALGTSAPVFADANRSRTATFDLTISNKSCFKGTGIDPYINNAIDQRRRAAGRGNVGSEASIYVAVPARAWRGLTVTGIGLHYETTSVYFRENTSRVRQVLQAIGVTIDANNRIPITSEEAVEVQILRASPRESRRYGASEVTCGV